MGIAVAYAFTFPYFGWVASPSEFRISADTSPAWSRVGADPGTRADGEQGNRAPSRLDLSSRAARGRKMKHVVRACLVLWFFCTLCAHLCRGIDTLIGIQGRDFVMLASDLLLHRSLVVMQQDRDKMPVVSRRRMLAIGGPPYFVDALGEILRADVGILEKRLRHPLSTKTVAHLCRRLFLEFRGLPSTMLVAGYDEGTSTAWPEAEGPCLYWLDSLGAMQKLRYAVHGEASSFLLSMLDQMCTSTASTSSEESEGGLTEGQALDIMKRCHEELQRRFLVNPGSMLQVKVVDRDGCRRVELAAESNGQRSWPILPRPGGGSGDSGGEDGGVDRECQTEV